MTALVLTKALNAALRLEDNPGGVPTGPFTIEDLARRYMEHCAATYHPGRFEKGWKDRTFWAWTCLHDLIHHDPELAFECVRLAVLRASDTFELDYLGAGPVEDLLHLHGDRMIEAIEEEAAVNARFRLVLNGVWAPENPDSDVWQRVLAARAPVPHLDGGDPLPVV